MAFRRPRPDLGQLLPGLASLMGRHHEDGENFIQRPEENLVPAVNRAVEDHPGHQVEDHPGDLAPIYIYSSDDDDDDGEVVFVDEAAGGLPPFVDHDDVPQLPNINPLDGFDRWAFDVVLQRFDMQLADIEFDEDREGEDSGYESMSEDEDMDEEDEVRQEILPLPAAHPVDPPGLAGPPSVPQRPEECAPSTSGLGSLKRHREERSPEQVGVKRARMDGEENLEDPAPSTSGLSSSSNRRFWHHPFHTTGWSEDSDSD